MSYIVCGVVSAVFVSDDSGTKVESVMMCLPAQFLLGLSTRTLCKSGVQCCLQCLSVLFYDMESVGYFE